MIGSLALAIDLGLGQPMDHILRTCLLAVRLGEAVGLTESELTEVYYLAMLSHVGCTAESGLAAAATGDDVASHAILLSAHCAAAEWTERATRPARRVLLA